jgi:hypothetical protein
MSLVKREQEANKQWQCGQRPYHHTTSLVEMNKMLLSSLTKHGPTVFRLVKPSNQQHLYRTTTHHLAIAATACTRAPSSKKPPPSSHALPSVAVATTCLCQPVLCAIAAAPQGPHDSQTPSPVPPQPCRPPQPNTQRLPLPSSGSGCNHSTVSATAPSSCDTVDVTNGAPSTHPNRSIQVNLRLTSHKRQAKGCWAGCAMTRGWSLWLSTCIKVGFHLVP